MAEARFNRRFRGPARGTLNLRGQRAGVAYWGASMRLMGRCIADHSEDFLEAGRVPHEKRAHLNCPDFKLVRPAHPAAWPGMQKHHDRAIRSLPGAAVPTTTRVKKRRGTRYYYRCGCPCRKSTSRPSDTPGWQRADSINAGAAATCCILLGQQAFHS